MTNSKKLQYDKILVLGSGGMLAAYILDELQGALAVKGVDREELDVSNVDALQSFLSDYFADAKQGLVINCVAYNNVDEAENKPVLAYTLNSDLPKNLVQFCGNLSVAVIHFSTGYVFDGEAVSYSENSPIHPLSVYAKSKAEGEEAVAAYSKGFVIRTNLLYGNKGASELSKRSFVEAFLNAGNEIKAIEDETNSSCYALDLAVWTVEHFISTIALPGIYHGVNEGAATWLQIAQEIFKDKPHVSVLPVSRKSFTRLAHRPQHAVLRNTKLALLRDWKSALNEFLISLETKNI